ncbi:MAG: gluconate 2-dehydrogenase subunit 3 family protein, partial [Cyclobacteriaceae bacterium]|nr:gluconate 2-dehydrogenase subunit 3 family protein [Cyclobacteriaceae bacterium]
SSSPGAKEVEIGKFINTIVSDCYDEVEQNAFIAGIKKLDDISILNYDSKFNKINSVNKTALLLLLESESKIHNQNIIKGEPPHYYTMMKQLTIWGYLSSETVGTKVLRHLPIPGRYNGCLPYEKGEKSWS